MKTALRAIAVVVAATGACGGGQTNPRLFSAEWLDDGGKSIEAVRARLHERPRSDVEVVVGVGENHASLVGRAAGSARWTYAHALDARPVIAGDVVVGSGGGEVFAVAATTGKPLWSRPTGGLPLRGAGEDGGVTVMTFGRTSGSGSVLLAVAGDGTVVRQVETDKSLGAPAVVSGLAFVPWGSQYVTVLDLSSGDEIGRVVLREQTSRAWTEDGTLYFGEVGVFRFDAHIRDASRGAATHLGLPARDLPGAPRLMAPGAEKLPAIAGAADKNRLYVRPAASGTALEADSRRFYATYFRLSFGFDAVSGQLAWVHSHDDDVVGADAGRGGLVTCDVAGKITRLDAIGGASTSTDSLDAPLAACVVRAGDVPRPPPGAAPPPIATQIIDALSHRDPQLATAHRLLLRELTAVPDEGATKTIIEVAVDPRSSPALVADARVALAKRKTGAGAMLKALAQRYDFLKDDLRPPPVGPLATALANIGEARAAAPLAAQLFEPANTDDDVLQTALALGKLATPKELPALEQFFAMYRASAESEEVAAAVVSVAQTIVRVGGEAGRALVARAAADAMTVPTLRDPLAAASVPPEPPAKPAEPAKPPAPPKPPTQAK